MSGAHYGRDDERERALIAMRARVIAAVGSHDRGRRAGSAAVEDAVDEALAQMYAKSAQLGALDHVRGTWIDWARKRLIDDFRSAEMRHRAGVSVDDGADSIALSVADDVSELSDRALEAWQIRELLGVVRGDERRWVEAYYDEIASGRLKAGAHPRGLHEVLGWTQAKTNKTAQRARGKMVAFAERRASGEVCDDLRELFDAFVVATSGASAGSGDLDQERFERVLFHTAGCASCRAAYRSRRRGLRQAGPLLGVPVDVLAGAWQGLVERLAGLGARLGVGGGAAAGGAAAGVGSKTAAVCMSVACVAGAATGELAGVLAPLGADKAQHARKSAQRPPRGAPVVAPAAAPSRPAGVRVVAPPPPASARRRAVTRKTSRASARATSSSATSSTPPPAPPPPPASSTAARSSTPQGTPGDLPPPESSAAAPAAPPPVTATRQPSCTPGDLGC